MHPANKNTDQFPSTFFILAFALTWLIWSPGILSTFGMVDLPVPFIVFFFIGTWGPFLAGFWVTYQDKGKEGIKTFLKKGLNLNFPILWILVMVLLALLVSALPLGLQILSGGARPGKTLLSQPWMIIPIFLTYFLTGGGNEEWGWRGYALDRLQKRWNPTIASIVLGLIWGGWHIPLFFIDTTGQYHMSLLVFLLATPGMSILHTWVYNKTGKNLLAVWLFHAMLGTAWEVFPIVQPYLEGYQNVYIYDFIAVTVIAVMVVLFEGTHLGQKQDRALADT